MSRKSSINTNLKDTILQLRENLNNSENIKTCCICFWGATRTVDITYKNICNFLLKNKKIMKVNNKYNQFFQGKKIKV